MAHHLGRAVPRITNVEHLDRRVVMRFVPEPPELLGIGLLPLQVEPVRVRVADAEDAAPAGERAERRPPSGESDVRGADLEYALEHDDREHEADEDQRRAAEDLPDRGAFGQASSAGRHGDLPARRDGRRDGLAARCQRQASCLPEASPAQMRRPSGA